MGCRFVKWCFATAVVVCLALSAKADEQSKVWRSPFADVLTVSGAQQLSSRQQDQPVEGQTIQLQKPLRVSAQVRGVGRVHFTFSTERLLGGTSSFASNTGSASDIAQISLYQGTFRSPAGEGAAAAMHYGRDGEKSLVVSFVGRSPRRDVGKFYRIYVPLNGHSGAIRVHRASKHSFAGRGCADLDEVSNLLEATAKKKKKGSASGRSKRRKRRKKDGTKTATTTDGLLTVPIKLVGDHEWYRKYGDRSNARLLSLVNESEAIFKSQVGFVFEVVSTTTISEPSSVLSSTNSDRLLTQFQQYLRWQNGHKGAQVAHLFTGKRIKHGVLGIATIGSVCQGPTEAIGLSEDIGAGVGTSIIFTHETGHNFGAVHDPQIGMIMGTYLDPPYPKRFSERSLKQMTGFISRDATCLAGHPQPEDTTEVYTVDPEVLLQTNLQENGELSVRIKVRGGTSDCVTRLHYGYSSFVWFQSPVLAAFAGDQEYIERSVRMIRSGYPSYRGQRLGLAASLICPNTPAVFSDTILIDPDEMLGLEAPVPFEEWVSELSHILFGPQLQ